MEFDVLECLLTEMRQGDFACGERFPSENEIALRYSVPRITARRALSLLEEMGYLRAERGRGRFVASRREPIDLSLSGADSFSDKMMALGLALRTSTEVAGPEALPADAYLPGLLAAAKAARYYRVRKLRIVEGLAAAIHLSWVDAKAFPQAPRECLAHGSMFAWFRGQGFYGFKSGPSRLSVALPSLAEREDLDCPSMLALLRVDSSTFDSQSGLLLQYSRILYRSDLFVYRAEL